jgi:hypothetical protein
VILLENPNEWNFFPANRRIQKKRREQGLKSKRGETSYQELYVKKRGWNLQAVELLSKERKKGDYIFL